MTDRSCPPQPSRPAWAAAVVALLPVLSAPLLGVGLAWGQNQLTPEPGSAAPAGPLVSPLPPPAVPLAQPLRPDPTALPSRPTARFDASLDSLVRDGVVSPAERARIRSGSGMTPFQVPAHQQACRSGALSRQECSSGLVVRWRGRFNQGSGADGGVDGAPPPTPPTPAEPNANPDDALFPAPNTVVVLLPQVTMVRVVYSR
jgi:hypothetical protein